MNCQRNTCVWLSIIVGVVAGILLGVLYSQGLFPIGSIFPFYIAFGLLSLLLYPLYAARKDGGCFCRLKALLLTATIGTVVSAAIGQLLLLTTSVTATAILLSFATLFATIGAVSLICLADCHCNN